MKIDDFIRLSILYHEIDEEKLRNNILRKAKKRVVIKRVLISVVITALIAVPVLGISYGISKDGDQQPYGMPVTSGTRYTSASVTTITQPQTEISSTASYTKRKIVAGKEEDALFPVYSANKYISDKLLKAFDYYDDTNFFIICQYGFHSGKTYLYKGKSLEEWQNKANQAKKEYEAVLSGENVGSAEDAKKNMEKASSDLEEAFVFFKKAICSYVKDRFSEKGIQIVSYDAEKCRIKIISDKETILSFSDENNDILYGFALERFSEGVLDNVYELFD